MRKGGPKIKRITEAEKKFAEYLAEGLNTKEAARKVFGWKCERFTEEERRAKVLAQSKRVKEHVAKIIEANAEKAILEDAIEDTSPSDWDNIHKYAFSELKKIRDDPSNRARVRYEALLALEKLSDPAQDINLIWKYIETIWQGFTAHCPCCHSEFPLTEIKNERLESHREFRNKSSLETIPDWIERRLYLLDKADKRRSPKDHESQMKAIRAKERNIIALGLARGGKSFGLAQLGLLHLLVPGSQLWILGRTYDDCKYEFEYIQNFLFTIFYPVEKHMYDIVFDKKTGDASITTRWGAELNVKSGKSKGSITGQELDCILVAEPGWVDSDLFEEVRARMSSRLGRIFAFGTPKGFGNFLGRMIRMSQRDMKTGKKLPPGSRLIENGCPWDRSLLAYDFDAKNNPEYVLSELEAARSELTEAEFASEFEGRMVADQDKKFPFIKNYHRASEIPREIIECTVVLGVDQGPKNFAGIIVGYDGEKIYLIDEYFDDDNDNTMKANLVKLNSATPGHLISMQIPPEKWILSIFDTDPSILGQLEEMKSEGRAWKTEITFKPKNKTGFTNWREETVEFINQMARLDRFIFCPKMDLLHEQMMEVIAVPEDPRAESASKNRKGWLVNDTWRGDHMLDAMMHAVWTIYSGALVITKAREGPENTWEYLEKEAEFARRKYEAEELRLPKTENEIFSDVFEREKPSSNLFIPVSGRFPYSDA